MWEREEEYKTELEQVIQKAGTSRLERLACLALEDERACYKHVMVILEKQYRKCGPNMRGKLHLLYCVSTLLRQSRKQQGARDRYAERLQPLISALVVDLRSEFSVQVDKLIKLWRMEGVYSAEQLTEVESGRVAVTLRQAGLQSKSPSGSLTEASAQDPHMGLGDASGSGRSSAIQSYPWLGPGRMQVMVPGALLSFQQQQQPPESQDPYSADSNPNGTRGGPSQQQAPLPPPPPPPLMPPGFLGPVGSHGVLPQGSATAAAAGLFQQGQLASFLGTAAPALMQKGAFMAPVGHFGAGGPGALAGGVAPVVGMGGHLTGGMGGAMPFPGAACPIPPGLGLERPPPYPPPPMYNNQNQGQSQGGRGMNYSRFNQTNGGRILPGLGPSTGSKIANHSHAHGWQGLQHLPPPPPRPPPGSPPHGADSRGSGTAVATSASAVTAGPVPRGVHRGSGLTDSGVLVPPGLGPSKVADGGPGSRAGSTSNTYGGTATGYIRPNGRRSRWEMERNSSDVPAMAAATTWTGDMLPSGTKPMNKRPALEVGDGSSASGRAPDAALVKLSLPKALPLQQTPMQVETSVPSGAGMAATPDVSGFTGPAADAPAEKHIESEEGLQQQQEDQRLTQTPRSIEQQSCSHALPSNAGTPMETSTVEGYACGHCTEDVAVADGKADPDGPTDQPDERAGPVIEIISVRPHNEQDGLVGVGKLDTGAVAMMIRPRASEVGGDAVEVDDDGGSSSAEAAYPAAQHQDSTAPASPGRLSGAAEQGESRDAGAAGSREGQLDLRQDAQQRRSSSSGAGECGYDRLSMSAMPDVQAVNRKQDREQRCQEQAAETAKAAEAVMSTNQSSLVEQCGVQQRGSNDAQSAEHPAAQQQTEETEERLVAAQSAVPALIMSLVDQPGESVDATFSNMATSMAAEAADSPEQTGLQQSSVQPRASDTLSLPNISSLAPDPSLVPASGSVLSTMLKAVEMQPNAPAPVSQQPPQHHISLQSSTLLLSSFDDSRVPLQLEELELGDLDESWLE